MIREVRRVRHQYWGIRSLVWDGDDLVDWVDGGNRFHPNGTFTRRPVGYSYAFDRAVVSPSGIYAVIYAELEQVDTGGHRKGVDQVNLPLHVLKFNTAVESLEREEAGLDSSIGAVGIDVGTTDPDLNITARYDWCRSRR